MHLAIGGQDQRRNKKAERKYGKEGYTSVAKGGIEERQKPVRLSRDNEARESWCYETQRLCVG